MKLHDHIRVIRGRRKGLEGYVTRVDVSAIAFREPLTWISLKRLATDVEVVHPAEKECKATDDPRP